MSASCIAGQTLARDGTSAIFTVKPSSKAVHADPHSCIEAKGVLAMHQSSEAEETCCVASGGQVGQLGRPNA